METELERTQEWLNTTANVLREIGEKDEILIPKGNKNFESKLQITYYIHPVNNRGT